ncbi:MAG: transposase [Proteobacteria bacterium]|nr:transposase [Pseudomonadota bacterium]MBU4469768.1 transposase [Pseudomonadota bacterium]
MVYNILFRSASDTLKQFAKDRFHQEIGFMAILHTWDQKLNRHLHIHCIVPSPFPEARRRSGISGPVHPPGGHLKPPDHLS